MTVLNSSKVGFLALGCGYNDDQESWCWVDAGECAPADRRARSLLEGSSVGGGVALTVA